MELLLLLAESRGRLVTRDEIAQRMWKGEVVVDTEHGINTAVRKIRNVLGDDTEKPKYIQTVTGMGYRFIATLVKQYPEESKGQPAIPESIRVKVVGPPLPSAKAAPQDQETDPAIKRKSRRLKWIYACIAVVALAAAASILAGPLGTRLYHRGENSIQSVAVLPLENLSGDTKEDYYADGMTDELTTMLARNSTLRVTSRMSAMQYKGAHTSLKEIARALNVDAVVEGSVQRTGGHVHVNLQLIQADTDSHLWANSYDRDNNDTSTLPDEASREIAGRVNHLEASARPAQYVKPEAHDAYLRGQYSWMIGDNEAAGKHFQQAVDIEPEYAAGWAGLAEYLIVKAMSGRENTPDILENAEVTARKAVALDDSMALAHNSLGAVLLFYHWDTAGALKELNRALELEPQNSQVLHLKAKLLCATGQFEEANAVQELSTAANPYAHPGARAEIYNCTREFEKAKQEGLARLEGFSHAHDVMEELAASYFWTGHEKESLEYLAREFEEEGGQTLAAAIRRDYKTGGYHAVLRDELTALNAKQDSKATPSGLFFSKGGSPVLIARAYAMLGKKDEAIKYLNLAADAHAPELVFFFNNPCFDSLHDDPRFLAIVKRMSMPLEEQKAQ